MNSQPRKTTIRQLLFVTALLLAVTKGFVPRQSSILSINRRQQNAVKTAFSNTELLASSSVIVISPPGGIGEVAAVRAACLGTSVRWFVISDGDGSSSSIALAPQTLQDINDVSGSLDLAGASVEDLKTGGDELKAVSKWCGKADGIICTYDGATDNPDFQIALRLATQEASNGVVGPQVAVLAAEQDVDSGKDKNSPNAKNNGISNIMGSLFQNSPSIPPTLPQSFSGGGNVCVVRHGELFGIPESSPDFSPLVGGPRRDPVIAEEYTMRTVRVDPFIFSGNVMGSSKLRSCRHCVGEAAALFATGKLPVLKQPISITSQSGTDEWTMEQWEQELDRVNDLVASGKASVLFSQEMIVDDTERLADWLATKWAPAVLRLYDIAAIRKGARPVYAARAGEGLVEITWQELVDFDSVNVGKMILEVTKDGITATRGSGDASKGYGSVSVMPLSGEQVLVQRLADAASQAVDKGLAKKLPMKKPIKAATAPPVPATTLQSAEDKEEKTPAKPQPIPETPKTGPRQAGARRSTPRSRGSRKTPTSQ